jgi:hypothetical protein
MSRSLRWGIHIWLGAFCVIVAVSETAAQPQSRAVARFSSDVFGGWDISLTPNRGLVNAPGQRDVISGGVNAAISYAKTFRNVSFTSSGSTSTRYSPDFATAFATFYGLTASLSSAGEQRWSWNLTQGLGYGRLNATSLFAGAGLDARSLVFGVPASPVDNLLSNDDALTSNSSATVGFGLSRRDRVSLGVNANTVFIQNGDQRQDLRVGATISYVRRLSRYANVRSGYNYFENRPLGRGPQRVGGRDRISSVDLGVGYSRPLPFSRQTTVSVTSGISGTPRRDGWFYTIVGSGGFTHSLGRSWTAQVTATRALVYVPEFLDPTLMNAVSASVAGSLSRRATTSLSLNYSTGESGFVDTATNFDAYSASAQVRYAIFRQAGLFAEYYYFLASILSAEPTPFPTGELARHGVRVGLTFGTELLGGRR